MTRRGWRFLAQRLDGTGPSSEMIDLDLPLQSVSITDVRSGPTQLNAALTPELKRLQGEDGLPLLRKWGTAIYAEHGGEIRAGAILTDPTYDDSSMTLNCLGFAAYPNEQPYVGSWSGVNVDPLDVVREAWRHLQAQPRGDLGLEVDQTTTTPVRIGTPRRVAEFDPEDDPDSGPTIMEHGPARLAWYETDDIGEYINQLASETPFDYHERHAWVGDQIHHYLDFAYPSMGNRREDLRFVIGENIILPPSVGSSEYATDVLALGNGEGRLQLRAQLSAERGTLRRAVTRSDPSLKSLKAVNNFAQRELARLSGFDTIEQVVLRDHAHARLGEIGLGDEIWVEGKAGWLEIGVWVRVNSIAFRPTDESTQVLSVTRSDMIGA